jgi:hypothetical protein
MTGMRLAAHSRPMTPWRFSSPGERGNEDIELRNFGSAAAKPQAARPNRVSNRSVNIKGLFIRECRQLQANLVAGARDIGKWLNSLGRKAGKLLAPEKSRAASMKTCEATGSRAAMGFMAATELAMAGIANARQLFSGKDSSPRAQAAKVRAQHDLPASAVRFATLKEVLGNDRKSLPSARRFIQQINRLYYRNKLTSQINELNLTELKLLWSHISQGGQRSLTPGASSMLCARGSALLSASFQADAIAHQANVTCAKRQLPDWAATAPAEWDPKAALRRAYGMQAGHPGIRSAAARPLSAASSQSRPQTAAPAAPRDKAASAPASGNRPSRSPESRRRTG